MNSIKNSQGFTLIELVIVIIILGILSATAVPKFINLKSDALISSMETLEGAIKSADQMVYMKAAISNLQNSPSTTVTIEGVDIAIAYGYPKGTEDGIVKVIASKTDAWTTSGDSDLNDDGDWHSRNSTETNSWIFWHGSLDDNAWEEQCFIRYTHYDEPDKQPYINLVTTGC